MIDLRRTSWTLGDLDLTWNGLAVVASSFDPGASGGSGDRTVSLTVVVAAPDLGLMADRQADLDRECAKPRNVLRHLARGMGAVTRYVVGEPSVTVVPDEAGEGAGFRRVELSWPVLSWPTADEASSLTFSGGAVALSVAGSRPTSLSLAVSGGAGLGLVLAASQPDLGVPWNPSLRQWTAATGTSGTRTFHPSQTWLSALSVTIPQASMQAGPHSLVGRFYKASSGTVTISWTGPDGQSYSRSVTWAGSGSQVVALGVLSLDPSAGSAAVAFTIPSGVTVDDVFAVYAGADSGVVIVDAGSNAAVRVDAPDVSNRMLGSVRLGAALRPAGAALVASSPLPVVPPSSRLYVASVGVSSPSVVASWLPAVQSHAVAS